MAPDKVLAMPCGLFWAMSAQIDRICAEQDLRMIGVNQCTVSSKQAKETVEKLKSINGEVYRYGGGWMVEADKDSHSKLLSLMRSQTDGD